MSKEWSSEVLAKNIRVQMAKHDINQKELAEIAGVSAPTVNDWLSCKKYPRIDKIQKMADYFGVLKSDLIEEKEKFEIPDGLSDVKKAFLEEVMDMPDEKVKALIAMMKAFKES